MGSTKEIAEQVGAELVSQELEVDVLPCSSGPKPESYDAVIIGSALYTRRWAKPASSYLKQYAPVLAERPTWLFRSGPCGPGAESKRRRFPGLGTDPGLGPGIAKELTQSQVKEDVMNSPADDDEAIPTFHGISPGRCTELPQT